MNTNNQTKLKISEISMIVKKISVLMIAASLTVSFASFAKDSLYAKGQKQLDSREWNTAQQTFSKLVHQKGAKQDAALYWLAYSQFKNKQSQTALKTLARLSSDFPKSNWLGDARALTVEIKDELGEFAEITGDEMKLYAINSLMNSSSEKSVPLLQKIIMGNSSNRIKKRALFVLSQSDKESAFYLIAKLASDDSNETLQKYAINILVVSESKRTIPLLKKIYASSKSQKTKINIIKNFMISANSDELVSLARTEKDKELRRRSIKMIGVMGKSKILLEMYSEKHFAEFRHEIIKAIAIGGGADALFKIIDTEKNKEFQLSAIKATGIIGTKKSADKLEKLYVKNSGKEIRLAIIKALFIQSNSKALVKLVKQEKDSSIKRQILRSLSIIGSDEASEYFDSVLGSEG